MQPCARRRTDTAPRQSGENKEEPERNRLCEGAGIGMEIRGDRARADQPRFRINPLEGGRLPKSNCLPILGDVSSAGCRDFPGEPEKKSKAKPSQRGQDDGMFQK